MSLIFDQFKTQEEAEKFTTAVHRLYPDLETQVFATEAEANTHDPFPYGLNGIIVHVDRPDSGTPRGDAIIETNIQRLAPDYGGIFAGT